MRLIERPEWPPHYCVISLKDEDPEGFVDFEINMDEIVQRPIAAVGALKTAARFVGMVDADQYEKALAELASATDRIAELEDEVEKHAALLDACDALQAFIDGKAVAEVSV